MIKKDCLDKLFHGSRKSISDIVKYCHTDPRIDYMIFLEECRKAEDEERPSKHKSDKKIYTTAATISHDKTAERTKQS